MAVKEENSIPQADEASTVLVNVNLVLARVVVRGALGKAVEGLHKEDFELFDNGKPQTISHFEVQHSEGLPQRTQPVGESTGNPDKAKPAQKLPVPERYIALLFDDLHLKFEDTNLVRKAAENRIDSSAPTDRIAVLTTSGQGMRDFTDDRASLHQAVENLQSRPSLGGETVQCPDISLYMADLILNKNDMGALQAAVNDYMHCTGQDASSHAANAMAGAHGFIQSAAQQVLSVGEEDGRKTIQMLKNAVRRLSVMPGQRNLILVSPGFLTPELELEYNEVIDRALRAQVMISTLDARGVYLIMPFGDASQSRNVEVDVAGQSFTPTPRVQLDLQGASAQTDTLANLAHDTGGVFFHNNNDMDEGFRRVAAAPETYYLLGFAPQNLKLDGKFHSLRVSVKTREKYEVQSRRGYYAPDHKQDPAEEARRELEDEVHSLEELHSLPVELHTQFFKLADDSAKLTVLARLDVRHLHYKKAEGRNQNDVTVVTAIFDHNGNLLQGSQKVVQMRWKDETLQGKLSSGITLKSSFDVKPGRYLVRLVARDTDQQKTSAENSAVEIP
jgi:VWFA-related protein